MTTKPTDVKKEEPEVKAEVKAPKPATPKPSF